MRKKLLLAVFCVCLLASCGENTRPSSLMAYVVTGLDNAPASRLMYYSDASPDTDSFLDADHIGEIYYDTFDINALCSDYAVMISCDDSPYEIHILLARAHSDLDEIVSALYGRRDLIQQKKAAEYNISGYERCGESAEVFTHGDYAVLLVTDDNKKAKKIICSH